MPNPLLIAPIALCVAPLLQDDPAALGSKERIAELKLRAEVDGPESILRAIDEDVATIDGALENAADVALARKLARALSRLRQLQLDLATSGPNAAAGQTVESSMIELVLDEFRFPNRANLERYGSSIVPELETIVRSAESAPELLMYPSLQPLGWLTEVAPDRGFSIALELLEREGRGWASAIASLELFDGLPQPAIASSEGRPLPKPYSVYQTLIQNPSVPTRHKVGATLNYLQAGVDTTLLRELAFGFAPQMSLKGSDLHWWQEVLMEHADPELRRLGFVARARSMGGEDKLELVRRFMDDPDASVRRVAAEILPVESAQAALRTPRRIETWLDLLEDDSPDVRKAAWGRLAQHVAWSNHQLAPSSPLDIRALTRVIKRLDDPKERELAAQLLPRLDDAVMSLEPSKPSVQEAIPFLELAGSEQPEVEEAVWEILVPLLRDPAVAAEAASRLDWNRQTQRRSKSQLDSISKAMKSLGKLPSVDRTRLLADLLDRESSAPFILRLVYGEMSKWVDLDPLGDECVPTLLRAAERLQSVVDAMIRGTDWSEYTAALRSAVETEPIGGPVQAAALAALCAGGPLTPERLDRVQSTAKSLVGAASDFDADRFLWWLGAAVSDQESALAILSAVVPVLPPFRGSAIDGLDLSDPALDPASVARLLELLDEQVEGADEDSVWYERLAPSGLEFMKENPEAFQVELARVWSRRNSLTLQVARSAWETTIPEGRELVEELRRDLRSELDAPMTRIQSIMDRLLALPGDGSVELLLDFARSTDSNEHREVALERVENIMRARELSDRYRGAGVPSLASATERMAALLDDDDETMTIEGMRGLATLGALEYMPDIIELLRDGSEAQRKAARIALDTLHAKGRSSDSR